jgi:hypothetical protein
MKTLVAKACCMAIAAVAMTLFTAGSALAQATVEINEDSCAVLDDQGKDWTIYPPALGGDAVVQAVLTPSGNSKITCNGTLPASAALPDRGATVYTFDDLRVNCDTGFGEATDDWINVVTRSGRVSLTCHINGQP